MELRATHRSHPQVCKGKRRRRRREKTKEWSRLAEATLLFCGQIWAPGKVLGSSSGLVSALRDCTLPYDFNMRKLPPVTVQSPLPPSWMRSRGYSSSIDARRKISRVELVSFYAGLDLKKQLTSAEASIPYGAWVKFATCPVKYLAMQGEDLSQWEPCGLCSLPLAC